MPRVLIVGDQAEWRHQFCAQPTGAQKTIFHTHGIFMLWRGLAGPDHLRAVRQSYLDRILDELKRFVSSKDLLQGLAFP